MRASLCNGLVIRFIVLATFLSQVWEIFNKANISFSSSFFFCACVCVLSKALGLYLAMSKLPYFRTYYPATT